MYELEATADVLVMTGQGKAAVDRRHLDNQPQISAELEPTESRESILVSAVLAGDRDMFASLYELYAPLVHGVLLARMPRSEVEDMVQEIFLHALRKLHTLREASAFGPWIAMIARNRAMDFHRRSRETVEIKEEHARGDRRRGAKAEEILE